MVSKTIDVGSNGYGQWQVIVEQTSQNAGANTSNVRVRGIFINNGNTSSYSASVSRSVSGTNSYSGTGTLNCGANDTQTFMDQNYTVTHAADGTKTVSYTVKYGATGTSTFGSGGSISLSLTLTRIPKVPDDVGKPTLAFTAPDNLAASWSAPDNNGDSLDNYQVQFDDSSAFTSPSTYTTTSRSYTKGDCAIGRPWYVRVRAHNGVGWGGWSSTATYTIPNIPSVPAVPTIVYTAPTTIKLSWTAPANGGAAITGYDILYDDDAAFGSPITKTSTTTSITITDVTVGAIWNFKVRAKNSQGASAYSAVAKVQTVAGPRLKVSGVYKTTVAYVKVAGVWKIAIPYVKVSGVWKIGGG